MAPDQDPVLLEVDGLSKTFPTRHGAKVYAVQDLSFSVRRGTTVGRSLLRLIEPSGGRILFDGVDLLRLSRRQMNRYRRDMQIIFQDPYSNLNPRLRVSDILGEALNTRGFPRGARLAQRVAELLTLVGLQPEQANRFSHEFSGGQRQRIGIARALAVEPKFIVADEPVSALDVSVQAQVLNLLGDLQRALGLTVLFIAHDLSVVEYLCDEVIVMYLGRIMESGPCSEVYARPRHPYTQALLSAVPDPAARRQRIPLSGDIPSPANPPSGCVFRTRCPHAEARCAENMPRPETLGNGHRVSCLRHREINQSAFLEHAL
ncbi:ATP-binding cassette domain-containing protein [Candidatus Sodalis endolongispinus]|uniref:ATP-binding cassette domain-containing protein n=2 Tax=Candidatus Sodalis endolongispinus TaxID=2812662 RepID=A0ABS5YDT2_9GAMM|nr:ATP-binding cassette domain-containing protein [Candidatus Sodalis endolongispinus]